MRQIGGILNLEKDSHNNPRDHWTQTETVQEKVTICGGLAASFEQRPKGWGRTALSRPRQARQQLKVRKRPNRAQLASITALILSKGEMLYPRTSI